MNLPAHYTKNTLALQVLFASSKEKLLFLSIIFNLCLSFDRQMQRYRIVSSYDFRNKKMKFIPIFLITIIKNI